MLGLEQEDEQFLSNITGGVIQALSGEEPFKSIGQARHVEFAQVVRRLMAERRAHPTDDLLSSLMNSSDGKGFVLSEEEICSFMTLLLIAGVETTELGLLNFGIASCSIPNFFRALPRMMNCSMVRSLNLCGWMGQLPMKIAPSLPTTNFMVCR